MRSYAQPPRLGEASYRMGTRQRAVLVLLDREQGSKDTVAFSESRETTGLSSIAYSFLLVGRLCPLARL
jgi:hypothetical protein